MSVTTMTGTLSRRVRTAAAACLVFVAAVATAQATTVERVVSPGGIEA